MNGLTKRLGLRALAGLLALTVVLTVSLTGAACSCAAPLEIDVALAEAQAVFSGRVVGLRLIQLADDDPSLPADIEDLEVTFAVQTVWKGQATETLVVRTGFTCCVCGYRFELGEEYLVYSHSVPDTGLYTSFCSRTKPLDTAWEEMQALGELTPVVWSAPEV